MGVKTYNARLREKNGWIVLVREKKLLKDAFSFFIFQIYTFYLKQIENNSVCTFKTKRRRQQSVYVSELSVW